MCHRSDNVVSRDQHHVCGHSAVISGGRRWRVRGDVRRPSGHQRHAVPTVRHHSVGVHLQNEQDAGVGSRSGGQGSYNLLK